MSICQMLNFLLEFFHSQKYGVTLKISKYLYLHLLFSVIYLGDKWYRKHKYGIERYEVIVSYVILFVVCHLNTIEAKVTANVYKIMIG